MALIKDHRVTVVLSLLLNLGFIVVKFVAFLYSHVNLFFADAIDSFVDFFVVFLVLFFLSFNFDAKLSLLSKDLLVSCQWSSVIVFRGVIILSSIDDIFFPQQRKEPMMVIIVSSIVLGGGI